MHTTEPLVPQPILFEVEIVNGKLERYKLPDGYQVQAELIQAEVKHYDLRSANQFFLFGPRKNCLISGRSILLYQFTSKIIKLTVAIIKG
jgi:hypothetical protein